MTLRIYECTKPVIAAMNGSAVGIGVTMTLPMDIRVLADDAKVGFVFASRGIVPEAASSWFLPRVVGISQALEWCLTARVFRAQEALAGGLVRSIHPADEVLDVARGLAAEIATNAAPVSAALTRQMLWRMLGADHPMEAHKIDSRAIYSTGSGRRRPRGHHRLPREAPGVVDDVAEPRHAGLVPLVGGPSLRLSRLSVRPPHPPIGAPGVSRCGTWTRDPRIPSRRNRIRDPDRPRRPEPGPRTACRRGCRAPSGSCSRAVVLLAAGSWLLTRLHELLLMLVVSLFLSFALEPAVDWLARRGWRRGSATGLVLVVLFLGTLSLPRC